MPPSASAPAAPPVVTLSVLGELPRRRLPGSYRLGLVGTAALMVLLLAVYLGLVGLVLTWAVVSLRGLKYAQTHADAALGQYSHGLMLILAFITLLFLVKPLFARSTRREAPATLDLAQQPQLRTLLAAMCAKIGAPMPVRVDVDCRVNASARLRRGVLSLGRNDLVLTIGLPLVGALDARQLASVLAHEFGHFAQGAGMATTYLIRSVNGWFARVVFERDAWDELLTQLSRRLGLRLGAVFWIARGMIWATRRVLHGLMLLGHRVACWHLRQMEFDADYYAIQVAGTEAFIATTHAIRRVAVAEEIAFRELNDLWRDRRLVDDFPGYLQWRRRQCAHEIEQAIEREPPPLPGWAHSHPADAARDDAARALNTPGLFSGDAPASALFHQYEELCREVTAHHYAEILQLTYPAEALLPTTEAVRPWQEIADARAALARLIGPALSLWRPVLWTEAELRAPLPTAQPQELARRLGHLRAEFARLRPAAEADAETAANTRAQWLKASVGREFFAANIQVDARAFELDQPTAAAAEARAAALRPVVDQPTPALQGFDATVREWVILVTSIAALYGDSLPGGLDQRIRATTQRLVDFRPWLLASHEWLVEQARFDLALEFERLLGDQKNYTLLGEQCGRVRTLATLAPTLVGPLRWPLSLPHAPLTVQQMFTRLTESEPPALHCAILLRMVAQLYHDTVGRLCQYGGELEEILTTAELE